MTYTGESLAAYDEAHSATRMYLLLDPLAQPHEVAADLTMMLPALIGSSNTMHQVMAAACAVEALIGVRHRSDQEYLQDITLSALDPWKHFQNITGPNDLMPAGYAELMGYLEGTENWPFRNAYSSKVLEGLMEIHGSLEPSDAAVNAQTQVEGGIREVLVPLIVNSPRLEGLYAYPSMPRQNLATEGEVDGKVVRWDVTVESDGNLLSKGSYHVQVKNIDVPSDVEKYHQDVHLLPMHSTFGIPGDNQRAATMALADAYLQGDQDWMDECGERILEFLDTKPPASMGTPALDFAADNHIWPR